VEVGLSEASSTLIQKNNIHNIKQSYFTL